jgi:hypothetical protein
MKHIKFRLIHFTGYGKNLSWTNLCNYSGIFLEIFRKTTFPEYEILPTRQRRSVNCYQICYIDTVGEAGGGNTGYAQTH